MYHIVPEIGFSIYIIVHWDCHGAVGRFEPDNLLVSTVP